MEIRRKIVRNLKLLFSRIELLLRPNLLFKIEMIQSTLNEILRSRLLENPVYTGSKRLEPFGFKVYSQNDEDGIIQEIFHRIGISSKVFVEFGVGNGLENNTAYLLMQGWKGLWIEGSCKCIKQIEDIYNVALKRSQLFLKHAFITKDNIDSLISEYFEGEIDLLSIDIDGNDYYVWENIKSISPRVIIVEYNGKFPPPCKYVMPYDEKHIWDDTDKMGMSLQSAFELGSSLGYQLVGTNLNGVNAFFVRKDLIYKNGESLFVESNSPSELYNLPRYQLNNQNGHRGAHFLG